MTDAPTKTYSLPDGATTTKLGPWRRKWLESLKLTPEYQAQPLRARMMMDTAWMKHANPDEGIFIPQWHATRKQTWAVYAGRCRDTVNLYLKAWVASGLFTATARSAYRDDVGRHCRTTNAYQLTSVVSAAKKSDTRPDMESDMESDSVSKPKGLLIEVAPLLAEATSSKSYVDVADEREIGLRADAPADLLIDSGHVETSEASYDARAAEDSAREPCIACGRESGQHRGVCDVCLAELEAECAALRLEDDGESVAERVAAKRTRFTPSRKREWVTT